MQYSGPKALDFDDVHALNRAFLTRLHDDPWLMRRLLGLRDDLATRLTALTPGQLERLAMAPFLLFSFRERDERFWDIVHAGEPPRYDLFAERSAPSAEVGRLIAAGLGFVWQLARRNPYVLRLICGASLHWCERLGDMPLLNVLDRASARDDLLALRSAHDANLWRKLLWSGVSRREEVRTAAHLCALHMMLTRPDPARVAEWSSAACRTRVPAAKFSGAGQRSTASRSRRRKIAR